MGRGRNNERAQTALPRRSNAVEGVAAYAQQSLSERLAALTDVNVLAPSTEVDALMQAFCQTSLARPGVAEALLTTLQAVNLLPSDVRELPRDWRRVLINRASTRMPEELYPLQPHANAQPDGGRRAFAVATRLLGEVLNTAIVNTAAALGPSYIEDIADKDERIRKTLDLLPATPEFSVSEWAEILREGDRRRFQSYNSQGQSFRAALLTALGGRVAAANYAQESAARAAVAV
jgi:hypothetical protein